MHTCITIDVGSAVRKWWKIQVALMNAAGTEDRPALAIRQNCARDAIREQLLRLRLPDADLHRADEAAHALMGEYGEAAANLDAFLSGSPENATWFLHTTRRKVCRRCSHVQPFASSGASDTILDMIGKGASTHIVRSATSTSFAPFAGFLAKLRHQDASVNEQLACVACGGDLCRRQVVNQMHDPTTGMQIVPPPPPPPLLWLDVDNQPAGTTLWELEARSLLHVPLGPGHSAAYRLIGILLYNGAHYITLLLCDSDDGCWRLYDGMGSPAGVGKVRTEPTGNNLPSGYRPSQLLYGHVPRTVGEPLHAGGGYNNRDDPVSPEGRGSTSGRRPSSASPHRIVIRGPRPAEPKRQGEPPRWREVVHMTYNIVHKDTHTLYLFGENEHDYGGQKKQTTTQAVIRRCLNAHPVRTCYGPGLGFRDRTLATNQQKIRDDLEAAVDKVRTGKFGTLVFPKHGLGTGEAKLKAHAPKTFAFLCAEIDRAKLTLSSAAFALRSPTKAARHGQ